MDSTFWKGKRASGVSDTVNLDEFDNINDFFNDAIGRFSSKPAFTSAGHSITFSDTDRLSTRFACYLQNQTTLVPGDRVAVQLPNILQYPVVIHGILKAGLVLVNINPLYTAREMKAQLQDSCARAMVFLDMAGERVQSILDDTPLEYLFQTSFADFLPQPKRFVINNVIKYVKKMVKPFSLPSAISLQKALKQGSEQDFVAVSIGRNDLAALQYTGGTTGKAKGAMLTHGNLLANMQQGRAGLHQKKDNGEPFLKSGEETIVAALPLYHIYAFTVHLMGFFALGANNILIPNPRDIKAFLKILKKNHVTGFVGINTLFSALLHHRDFKQECLDGLKVTTSGGTALKAEVAKLWKEKTGCTISEGYGLTECSPIVAMNPLGTLAIQGTVGVPVPETSLKVIDPETGKAQLPGQTGELCVKGPQVMKGYWHDSEATASVLDQDGWLRTGDVAEIMENGFVRIIDRIKDVILVSGFNVYPNEVEDVVSSYPGILQCAAVGIPDENTGEAVKIYIVPENDSLSANDLLSYCRENLTGYKIPRQIEFRKQLPLSPVGKVLRKDLRQERK